MTSDCARLRRTSYSFDVGPIFSVVSTPNVDSRYPKLFHVRLLSGQDVSVECCCNVLLLFPSSGQPTSSLNCVDKTIRQNTRTATKYQRWRRWRSSMPIASCAVTCHSAPTYHEPTEATPGCCNVPCYGDGGASRHLPCI